MSLLNNITTGKTKSGLRMVVCGNEKIGKTTFSCYAPNKLLIPLEVGFANVEGAKYPIIQNYVVLMQLLDEITTSTQQGKFPFKSIVFDSVTAIERLLHEYVITLDPSSRMGQNKSVTMESAHGGYGKAYNMANAIYEQFLQTLDNLAVYGGINIILTAHVFSSKVIDPTVGEFNTWDLLLHSPKNEKTYGKREITTQWADIIGFIYEPIFLIEGDKSNRGMSQNVGRKMAINRTPGFVAGNRFGIKDEISLQEPPANSWNDFAEALMKSSGIDVFNKER